MNKLEHVHTVPFYFALYFEAYTATEVPLLVARRLSEIREVSVPEYFPPMRGTLIPPMKLMAVGQDPVDLHFSTKREGRMR
jgi:hypothetical protein